MTRAHRNSLKAWEEEKYRSNRDDEPIASSSRLQLHGLDIRTPLADVLGLGAHVSDTNLPSDNYEQPTLPIVDWSSTAFQSDLSHKPGFEEAAVANLFGRLQVYLEDDDSENESLAGSLAMPGDSTDQGRSNIMQVGCLLIIFVIDEIQSSSNGLSNATWYPWPNREVRFF